MTIKLQVTIAQVYPYEEKKREGRMVLKNFN